MACCSATCGPVSCAAAPHLVGRQVDAEMLPESRWPYKSPRGKVRVRVAQVVGVEWGGHMAMEV